MPKLVQTVMRGEMALEPFITHRYHGLGDSLLVKTDLRGGEYRVKDPHHWRPSGSGFRTRRLKKAEIKSVPVAIGANVQEGFKKYRKLSCHCERFIGNLCENLLCLIFTLWMQMELDPDPQYNVCGSETLGEYDQWIRGEGRGIFPQKLV